jgi:hypothetical protein
MYNLNYTRTASGYKVEENLHVGVREQKKKVEYHWSRYLVALPLPEMNFLLLFLLCNTWSAFLLSPRHAFCAGSEERAKSSSTGRYAFESPLLR